MVPVVELFKALQGEGAHMGVPSIFVRTGGCSLKCEGFGCTQVSALDNTTVIKGCDSIHAVNVSHYKHTWNYYSEFSLLVQAIEKEMHSSSRYSEKQDIVFTGGEPLIHYKDPVMLDTIEYFLSRGHRIFFESNGTIDINFEEYPIYKDVRFTISAKMSNSGEAEYKRWKPDVVSKYLKNTKNSFFKFVLTKNQIESFKEGQEDEILSFLKLIPTFAVVYIMPQGEVTKTINENCKAVYEYCLEKGFRYSDRLHIRMYEDMKLV